VAYEENMNYFSGFNSIKEIGFGGMDNNCVAIAFVACTGLGIFLCFGAPRVWQKAVAAGCVGFLVHAILLTFSRGGMIGLILVVGLSFFLIPKRPVHYLTMIGGVLLTLSFTGQEVVKRFDSVFAEEGKRDESAQSRLDMWAICARVAADKPLLGLGPYHFHLHSTEYGLPPGKEAHTTWLQLAAELGIPGVGFLLAFFTLAVVRSWRLARGSVAVSDPFLRDIARMVIAATIGFLFTAQFVTVTGIETPYYIVLLGAGALKLTSHTHMAPNTEAVAPPKEATA
jgi:O-antigen ligase